MKFEPMRRELVFFVVVAANEKIASAFGYASRFSVMRRECRKHGRTMHIYARRNMPDTGCG